jgi:hypothetical protein
VPPPPPPPPPRLPHFEIVSAPARQQANAEVFDFSQLNAGDDGFEIDTGVTSGADTTSWEEISVAGADSCEGAAANGASSVCSDSHAEKSTSPKP